MPSSLDENKALVKRFSNEFKNKANHGIVDELMTPNFQHHFKDPRLPKGREGMKAIGRELSAHFQTSMRIFRTSSLKETE